MIEAVEYLYPHSNVPQEKLVSGKLPSDVGSDALHVINGLSSDRYDANRETKYLKNKVKTYKEMTSDPTVGGSLQGYENILSLVKWSVEPVPRLSTGLSEDEYDEQLALEYRDYVQSCFDDMTGTSTTDTVAAALGMLTYGHQVLVPHFKIRKGENDQMRESSKYDDGRIGWKSWKSINPESIDRWIVPDGGGYSDLNGLVQNKVNGGWTTIPRNRFLLFRTTAKGDTIEGESILYSAVKTWIRLQNILTIEDVALSRNLEGIPKLEMPSRYLSSEATPDQKQLRDLLIRMVKSVKYNEQSAVVVPSDTDENGNKLIEVSLMTAGSNVRVDQCRKTAKDCEQLIAESVLANFLKLGSSGSGSYAMSSSLQDMFVLAMKKYLNNISSVINSEAIPTLLRLNGMNTKYAPVLVHQGLDNDSLGMFVDALMKAISAGAVVPTKSMQKSVLNKLGMPLDEADEAWDRVEELQQELLKRQMESTPEPDSRIDNMEKTDTELSPDKMNNQNVTK